MRSLPITIDIQVSTIQYNKIIECGYRFYLWLPKNKAFNLMPNDSICIWPDKISIEEYKKAKISPVDNINISGIVFTDQKDDRNELVLIMGFRLNKNQQPTGTTIIVK
jgi:hypothetical protein